MKKRYNKVGTTRTLFIIICLAWPLLQWAVFYLGININSILMAFQRSIPGSPDKYWTLENFRRIFIEGFIGEEPLLLQATKNTIVFFLFNFLILSPLNIFVGYFFYKKIPGTKVFRFIFYLPAIIPGTVMATLFKYIISPESSGVLATIFGAMGVRFPNLLGSSEYAMKTMLVYNAWVGFTGFLITVNSMRRIPTEIIESAQLDGITPLKEVVFILVPLIWPTIAVGLLMSVMGIFTSSGPILFFTQGTHGTYTIAYWLFEKVLTNTNMEYAAAVGIFYTLLGFPLLYITRKLSSKIEAVEY